MDAYTRADLLDQILADPDDVSLRKKWARAWEHDDPEFAYFVDLDVRLSRARRRIPHPNDLYTYDAERHRMRLERDRLLVEGVRERLLGARPWPLTDPIVQDGFVAGGRVVAEDLLRAPEGLFGRYPVRHLSLTDARPHVQALSQLPRLAQVRTLALSGDLTDGDLDVLLTSEHLTGLMMLDLRGNALTEAAAVALAHARHLESLQVVRLDRNPCPGLEIDPWVDQGHVIGWTESDLAIRLRGRFGPLGWLDPANTMVTDPACF